LRVPELQSQIQNLRVIQRKYTGIGIYVNFDLDKQSDIYHTSEKQMEVLGSSTSFYLDALEYEIAYELNLTKTGKFQFIEIVSNEGDWKGNYNSFEKRENGR
jgi:hypothetical protein